MRILVTGGAGFIGSHVVDACLAAGHDVVVVDDLSTGREKNVDTRARCHRVDIRSAELDRVFAMERPEIVSHHAAQVSVMRSVKDPVTDGAINVMGSLNLFEAARRHGTRRIVLASTGGAIYGEQASGAAGEDHPCRPRSPYAVAKFAVEHYLDCFRALHGVEAIVLRYANVYGPRQDPHGEAGVVAIFLERALAGRAPVIFGDGEQIRDFVYVGDVARANLAALEHRPAPDEERVFNIGTGRATSVNALWEAVASATGSPLTPRHEAPRAGEVFRSVLDATRARQRLGWTADVGLADGVQRTWEWFRQ